jgi:hypothetical protein
LSAAPIKSSRLTLRSGCGAAALPAGVNAIASDRIAPQLHKSATLARSAVRQLWLLQRFPADLGHLTSYAKHSAASRALPDRVRDSLRRHRRGHALERQLLHALPVFAM